MATNLQYGLDLQQGAWIQLEFSAEVVGFTTDHPLDEFIAEPLEKLDAEVLLVDATHLEIRKSYTQEELEPIFAACRWENNQLSPGCLKVNCRRCKTHP